MKFDSLAYKMQRGKENHILFGNIKLDLLQTEDGYSSYNIVAQ